MISNIRNILIVVAFLCVIGCKKDRYQVFPQVPVDITLSIATELSSLGIGQAMALPARDYDGARGIIIYRMDLYEFVAYDRLCTYYPKDTCAIVIDKSKIIADCPCCKSQFELVTGSIVKGPAGYSLKQYKTTVQGNFLYIRN